MSIASCTYFQYVFIQVISNWTIPYNIICFKIKFFIRDCTSFTNFLGACSAFNWLHIISNTGVHQIYSLIIAVTKQLKFTCRETYQPKLHAVARFGGLYLIIPLRCLCILIFLICCALFSYIAVVPLFQQIEPFLFN